MAERFWDTKSLEEMTAEEWESLCDGCALCCLQQLEDEDSGEVFYTRLACELLDINSGLCRNYAKRFKLVDDCVKVRLEDKEYFHWMPFTCAYRSLYEGRGLQDWHPLISGDRESVHRAGISVRGRAVPSAGIPDDQWEEHIIRWVRY